ncbi:MAG: DNA repair protein RecN [candidate division NC10 bacterium]|nr:DNA repair protein RecN [candidate division NC10 bacterium]
MLRELHVRDFALIEKLSMEFGPGFNVLTGETGAGKSIIIDALAFLLGSRSTLEQLRSGAREAVVEGSFDLPPWEELGALLEQAGLSQDPDQFLLLRRHLLPDGKSKAYVNGSLVPLFTLRNLGDYLVDIQGQHQSQSLLETARQLKLLDAYAGNRERMNQIRACYQQVQRIKKELAEAIPTRGDATQRMELLQFQREEIEAAHVRAGEEEEIAQERGILANAERLFGSCQLVLDKISEDSGSSLASLSSAISSLKAMAAIDARLATPLEALESARIQLQEAAFFLKSYKERIDFDPARLEELEMRLSLLAKLKRKYGGTIPEVLAYHQEILQEIEAIRGWADRKDQLIQAQQDLLKKMADLALEVSRARKNAALSMEERVQEELRGLGMPQAVFRIVLFDLEDPEGELLVEGKRYPLSARGVEGVEFLFSSNPGEPAKPLAKIASGGELSRALLALKTVLATLDEIPTLILDEVDVGISGSMAEVVGKKISSLGRQRQVICITHLPQIAAFGDAHFHVAKEQREKRTQARARRLDEKQRVSEIARMLGDKGTSKTPLLHAAEIVSFAQDWKRMQDASLATSSGI